MDRNQGRSQAEVGSDEDDDCVILYEKPAPPRMIHRPIPQLPSQNVHLINTPLSDAHSKLRIKHQIQLASSTPGPSTSSSSPFVPYHPNHHGIGKRMYPSPSSSSVTGSSVGHSQNSPTRTKVMREEEKGPHEELYAEIPSLMEYEWACGICQKLCVDMCAPPCRHHFCDLCIKLWYSNESTMKECPTCRKGFELDELRKIEQVDRFVERINLRLGGIIRHKREGLVEARRRRVEDLNITLLPDISPHTILHGILEHEQALIPPIPPGPPPTTDAAFTKLKDLVRMEIWKDDRKSSDDDKETRETETSASTSIPKQLTDNTGIGMDGLVPSLTSSQEDPTQASSSSSEEEEETGFTGELEIGATWNDRDRTAGGGPAHGSRPLLISPFVIKRSDSGTWYQVKPKPKYPPESDDDDNFYG